MNKEMKQQLKSIPLKHYAHFDGRISMKTAWDYVTNPQKIIQHHFYPFICYDKDYTKYNKNKGVKSKKRKLCYSAHIDRCIYQYYACLLNEIYNQRTSDDGIVEVAVAYRNNLKKNNIHFAKQAIDFIRNQKSCYIFVGDFTNFFDSLNHKYLKKQICSLLTCEELPDDYYAVFKNITQYSEWNLSDLLLLNKMENTIKGRRSLNQKETILTLRQFKDNKHQFLSPGKKRSKGIPQGSAISAVLANVYMLEFDKQVNDYVKSQSGLYMRYSDDFIIVLPMGNDKVFQKQYDFICQFINAIPDLQLESKKTQIFEYTTNVLHNCNDKFIINGEKGKDFLDYLGFTFDGKTVTVRDKTLSKYYYRMYRKLETIIQNRGVSSNGNKISCKRLYLGYSERGAKIDKSTQEMDNKHSGNFLTYINRAKKVFSGNENIERGTKRHMQKIRKKLKALK
ncbi:Reverse transcriptase (RNA-dependent DNA polymerase) [Propionispira arboris]|uniref:Reverse transcriptase (RNA-dependent DNA polymerase) n=1 Tax=Propionispira arboris TaxID=84035 RepID=A0A1H7AFM2_9FIRM|nr:reverse transcriptase/maturase family protein [Propionispira arboris]SEJ60700.1 Reverse transcriptase (RNA-dependent DNA polymerase) [Propionispira arboris]